MVKKFFMLAAAILSVSCAKDIPSVSGDGLVEISLRPGSELKSTFERDGEAVVWSEGDRMSVLDGMANRIFKTEMTSSKALFFGYVDAEAEDLTVVYPYDQAVAFVNGNDISAVLPTCQWAVPGKISDEAMLSVGRASVSLPELNMRNVAGFVSVVLPSGLENVTKIDFCSNGGEILSGKLTIAYDGVDAPSVISASGDTKVSLLTPFGSLAGGEYFFCVNPVSLASGFTLTFHRSDGKTASLSSSEPNVIFRNKLLKLGRIDVAKLSWSSETLPSTRTVTVDFNSWPFDEYQGVSKFPDTEGRYVTADGMGFDFLGEAYYASPAFVISAAGSSLTIPGIPGHRLSGVTVTASEACSLPSFTSSDGTPVSARDFNAESASVRYRIQGLKVSEGARMKIPSSLSLIRMMLEYEIVSSSIEVKSVVSYNGVEGSFTFNGGSAADYLCGIEYIPSGSEDWSGASVVDGTVTSASSSSAAFTAVIPSGAFKARAWARPASCGADANRYGKLFYTPQSLKVIDIDFSQGPCFTKYGTSKGGVGTIDSPRYGYDFPKAKQSILNPDTGETSNDGSSVWGTYKTFTGYLTNYPSTLFNLTRGGETFQFNLGTGQGAYNAYLYHDAANHYIASNKALFKFPGIPGCRIRRIVFNMSSPGAYSLKYGMGTSNTNVGVTETTIKDAYKDIALGFPVNVPSGTNPYIYSANIYYMKRISIEYVKD